jgi:hypothetical protein
MSSKLKSAITWDMRIISSNYRPFIPVAILLLVIIILPVFFPVLSHSEYLKHRIEPDKYFTLISITLVSMVPMLAGLAYGRAMLQKERPVKGAFQEESAADTSCSVYIRLFTLLVISFILIILSIFIINPVPSQGWLRTLYAAILLSFQAPAGFLYPRIRDLKKIAWIDMSVLYWLFLIALPVGLLLHHPWNRIACFSPYYWIAWAWMLKSPNGSMIYGSIAVIFTSIVITVLLRLFLRRSA